MQTLVTGQDDDDYSAAPRARTRQKDTDHKEKIYQYFKGPRAVQLYLKSLQLILQHQVQFLIQDKGLPAEIEIIVRELWCLRIAKLGDKMTEAHDYDSQSQGLTTDASGPESDDDYALLNRKLKLNNTPGLIDCLALCYLGITTLRLDTTPGDICDWTINDKMPYHRAIKYLPKSMKDRLPSGYHAVLDPNSLLNIERFYSVLLDIASSLQKEHGIKWPPLNHPLLLARYIQELALPLELYHATTELARVLDYSLALSESNTGKSRVQHLPEAQLASCLVVCTKLAYPFDRRQRHPQTMGEAAAVALDWEKWLAHVDKSSEGDNEVPRKLTSKELATVQEADIFEMADNQLDEYLDWYQDTFIDQDKHEVDEYRKDLYSWFPIDRDRSAHSPQEQDTESKTQRQLKAVSAVHGTMQPIRIIKDTEGDDVVRPGQHYTYYRNLEELPDHARKFYEMVAKVAGLSLEMLVMAVFFAETAIEKRRKQDQKLATAID
ncbi:hypothetical protein EJ04DRAFT_432380 [Polyplosphaeria fusca]|uniref:Uncharacterized protein n=1 Tax=Polyplosphaeria fusca TaxID=682080 RepID=A0A9P4R276_9PLEO|nr:hypothetical protein EJ04DRAFT_432380 [Polyplosphaeria fusca]